MNVFITGASSGIGEALAREYARKFPGANLGLLARRGQALNNLAESLTGVHCHLYVQSIQDRDALYAAAADFTHRVGNVDIVIANAGISGGTQTANPNDSDTFRQIIDVNVNALHDTFGAFLPAMQRQASGRLVGIGSVAGVRGMPGSAAYCASKAAANTYLESLRVELRDSPIHVITIAPGFIKTPMTARNRFKMPFLMSAQTFAIKAVTAIAANRSFVVIPWQMGWVARLARVLPNAIYDRMMSRAPRKSAGL